MGDGKQIDGDKLDRRDLDDPQSPNHPMVTPHRVDNEGKVDPGRQIHDDDIAEIKAGTREAGEFDELDDAEAEVEARKGTPSEGVGANDDVPYVPPEAGATEVGAPGSATVAENEAMDAQNAATAAENEAISAAGAGAPDTPENRQIDADNAALDAENARIEAENKGIGNS